MNGVSRWLDDQLYPSMRDNWDNELFREEILGVLRAEYRVLDLGAGVGIVPQMNFRGRVARVYGVDPDPRVAENPYLDEASVGVGEHLPFPDCVFDLVYADNVVEHLREPVVAFREVARVLKPGGIFLFKTPNRLHYVPLIASATPQWFHQFYNRMRGRPAGDTFPTHYHANTLTDVARITAEAGLVLDAVRLVEGRPEYLRLFPPAYFLGWMYERAVNSTPALERFRVVLVARLRRPTSGS